MNARPFFPPHRKLRTSLGVELGGEPETSSPSCKSERDFPPHQLPSFTVSGSSAFTERHATPASQRNNAPSSFADPLHGTKELQVLEANVGDQAVRGLENLSSTASSPG